MEKVGKRHFYIIHTTNNYDGCISRIWRVSTNKKEAIEYFKWLYNDVVYKDYLDTEGEPFYYDRDYHLTENKDDKEIITGEFWYTEDDGGCTYYLTTCNTNMSLGWHGESNNKLEERFKNYLKG